MGPGQGMGPGRGMGPGPGMGPDGTAHPHLACTFGKDALTDAVKKDIEAALVDEWKAEAAYSAFSAKLGSPFPRLERAEARHADLLVQLLSAHGQAAPSRPEAKVPEAATAAEACAIALKGEKENVALYDKLLAASPPEDVGCVYKHLRALSADRHIPALERCAPGRP